MLVLVVVYRVYGECLVLCFESHILSSALCKGVVVNDCVGEVWSYYNFVIWCA